jgi:Rad3-related DNA helicases
LLPVIKSLLLVLNSLQETLRRNKSKSEMRAQEALLERLSTDLGFFMARISNLNAVWNLLGTSIPPHAPPIAKWFTAELSERGKEIEYTLHTSPVRAATLLAERFWCVAAGAVLTSATLRSLGSFDKFLTETGLSNYPQTTCIALESPFNLAEQGTLVIPAMQSDPKNPDAHTKEVAALLPKLLNADNPEGALVLFSSKNNYTTLFKLCRLLYGKTVNSR